MENIKIHTHPALEKHLNVPKDHCIVDRFENIENVSDGHHTFNELYDHRITLFIALCKAIDGMNDVASNLIMNYRNKVVDETKINIGEIWRSKKHSDDSTWDGWFIMGIRKEKGFQITYHLPIERWEETNFAETLDKAPEFDGHTPADVLEQLKNL